MARSDGYIHGFGSEEEQRLWDQAEILSGAVFAHMELPDRGRLLELGCGVGAELAQVERRYPDLKLFGAELSPSHARAARHRAGNIAEIIQADATALPLPDNCMDAVMTIWLLEHVADPLAVMAEALRVLRPAAPLICTEVDNATFAFDPPLPSVREWWDRFCQAQSDAGGDPLVGRHLGQLADTAGALNITSRVVPAVSTATEPHRREVLVEYASNLLLSGAEHMFDLGVVSERDLRDLQAELEMARNDSGVNVEYSAVQMTCQAP